MGDFRGRKLLWISSYLGVWCLGGTIEQSTEVFSVKILFSINLQKFPAIQYSVQLTFLVYAPHKHISGQYLLVQNANVTMRIHSCSMWANSLSCTPEWMPLARQWPQCCVEVLNDSQQLCACCSLTSITTIRLHSATNVQQQSTNHISCPPILYCARWLCAITKNICDVIVKVIISLL